MGTALFIESPLILSSASEVDRTLISVVQMMKLWLRDVEQLVQSHRAVLCHGLDLPSGLHRFKVGPLYNSPGLSWITEFALTHNNVIPQMTPRLKGRNKTNVTF